jgi:hypothetical protein
MSIYTTFTTDDIVEANPTVVTTGLWSGDTGSLEAELYLNTGTGQQLETSAEYYLDLYDKDPSTNPLAEVQFSVTYGHINGGGAPSLTENEQATLPTKAIYSQYKNLLLDPSDTKFSFQGNDSDHIYVINFQRSRIREQLDPGNWELPLSGASGLFTFIDDSGQTLGALTANSKAGRVFSIISGALSTASGSVTASTDSATWRNGQGYGLVYPDLGIIVLNPNAIGPAVGFFASASNLPAITGSVATSSITTPFYSFATLQNANVPFAPIIHSLTDTQWGTRESAYNHAALFNSINLAVDAGNSDKGFRARSAETISSTHYFVRLRNKEYNYSNNPTFYNPDNGSLINAEFRNDPKVYISTVGLYNDQNELLAVAKLSKPVRKSFDEEILLRIRLDF